MTHAAREAQLELPFATPRSARRMRQTPPRELSPCCGKALWQPYGNEWDRMCCWCGAHRCTGYMSPEHPDETAARVALQAPRRARMRRIERALWRRGFDTEACQRAAAGAVVRLLGAA